MSDDSTIEQPRHRTSSSNIHRHITWAAILVAISVVSTLVVGILVNRARQAETNRADIATYTAEQLCDQVRQLGAICVIDPADLPKGDRGEPGPAGRPPTAAEIRDAVDEYVSTHPPSPGRPPTPEEIGVAVTEYLLQHPPAAGPRPTEQQVADAVKAYLTEHPAPACPTGWHQGVVTLKGQNGRWETILTCVSG